MLTDSTMGQIAIGSVSVVLLLAVMLVLLPRFRNEADEIFEDEPTSDESTESSSPPAGVSFSAPPSSAFDTSSHRRGRHRSSASMSPSWGASQDRQNSANMAAMGAATSISHQTQMNQTPQSNIQPSVPNSIQAPPRPKGLDNDETPVQDAPAKAANIDPEPENHVQQEPVSTGVMAACEGTIQGQTGWYHDGMGNTSYWEVDEGGSWTRLG
jgi:FtsZ-interacting cell division protein ZipA